MKEIVQLYWLPGQPGVLKTSKGKKVRMIQKDMEYFILLKGGKRIKAPIMIDGVIRQPQMLHGRPIYRILTKMGGTAC